MSQAKRVGARGLYAPALEATQPYLCRNLLAEAHSPAEGRGGESDSAFKGEPYQGHSVEEPGGKVTPSLEGQSAMPGELLKCPDHSVSFGLRQGFPTWQDARSRGSF